ncbi:MULTISPECIES: hypothetical protein [Pseudomonas]|uniref:hypothetical protein n=1 Tax=Pseudomonas TaxID=286 RepID=UPI002DBDB96B|nr:hypothetical protein [Pseudomonas putida]WRW06256.1 hypothetical protein VPZ82_12835 [Pseudomonas putida]
MPAFAQAVLMALSLDSMAQGTVAAQVGGRFTAHLRLPEKPFTGTGIGADSMLGTSIFTREWF